jgi:hypothetical protein
LEQPKHKHTRNETADAATNKTMKVVEPDKNQQRSEKVASTVPITSKKPQNTVATKQKTKKIKKKRNDDREDTARLSDISASSSSSDDDPLDDSVDDYDDDNSADCERFERELRAKHSRACKAMSVRFHVLYLYLKSLCERTKQTNCTRHKGYSSSSCRIFDLESHISCSPFHIV